jgi:hypothetical protein
MKLLELDPRWLVKDGQRVGFTFISPTNPKWRQSCFVVMLPSREQWALFEAEHGEEWTVQGCKSTCAWTIEGGIEAANFATLTVKPSLDGSRGGLWHGHITEGEIR